MSILCTGLAAMVLAAPLAGDVVVGTEVQIRLLTALSSYGSKPGDPVEGIVLAPLLDDRKVAVPPGSLVFGSVEKVRRVGLGLVHETARLELRFDRLELPSGETLPLQAHLFAVDNARERVDRRGRVLGSRATASISHRMWYRVAGMALNHPIGLGALFLAQNTAFRFPDPEIYYGTGTEMRIVLDEALPLEGTEDHRKAHPAESAAALEKLVESMPQWSYSKRQMRPLDITNLIYVGSREAIERAFTAAGWTGSHPLSPGAGFRIARAIFEDRGYPDAPMRTLLADGAEPDMSWQKALNTFKKRHHLRIWSRPERWHSEPVWLSAATWDVATTFSFRYGLDHVVQANVDIERDKVANDLLLTGCVDSAAYVHRPTLRSSIETSGRRVETDGNIAVLFFNSCESPRFAQLDTPEMQQPGRFTRVVRRVTLTTRNHFLRDNIVWRSGEGGLTGIRWLRKWHRNRRTPESAASSGGPAAAVLRRVESN